MRAWVRARLQVACGAVRGDRVGTARQASVGDRDCRVREVNVADGSRHTTLALAIREATHAVVLAKLPLNRCACNLEVTPKITNVGKGVSIFTVYLQAILLLIWQ